MDHRSEKWAFPQELADAVHPDARAAVEQIILAWLVPALEEGLDLELDAEDPATVAKFLQQLDEHGLVVEDGRIVRA